MNRREFIGGALAASAVGVTGRGFAAESEHPEEDALLDLWQKETDQTSAKVYNQYFLDGDTRGRASLEKLEQAFEKVFREAQETKVEGTPAVWSVYNMGYIVKTRESMFSIDLNHRRAPEFAPLLDFALITHNHDDHFRPEFYNAMNRAGKTVVSNFLDNYGVKNWQGQGGFIRGVKTFHLRDAVVRTSLVDHNRYLIDFTTAFEISVGGWKLYHTGDCGVADKLATVWGRPDLWLFFPGCGVDVADAVLRVGAKRTAFGHLWELGHHSGRLTTPLIKAARARAESAGVSVEIPMWGTRIA